MKKIRIGNDIFVTWSIFDAEGVPYDLTGKRIAVSMNVRNVAGQRIMTQTNSTVQIENFTIQGNKIMFFYYGKNQRLTGVYDLKFVENDNLRGMVSFDLQGGFEIVEHSWQEEQGVTTTIELESVELESQIDGTIMAEIERKADKVVDAEEGNLAGLNSTGNLVDSGIPASEVTSLREDLTAENERAEQAEQTLSDKVDTDVLAEKNRALAAENELSDKIDADVAAEKARAEEAEATLSAKVETDVNAEKNRAQGVEATLSGRIDSEQSRAEEAENEIGAALTAEGVRAAAAEQALATRTTSLEGRAAALESGKQDVISDLQTIRSGAALGATAMQPDAFWINE